ncbi:hypothetical protein [Actinomadura sp. NBRC 104412]|uniref:hypothetical protein n=1 Tax=Actinomadura sp. NBRC 104412 TaxID=3032203 RepID=UPI0025535C90|nr:hypothetical protein [Actinomadura sp. NBRC 104412]
MADAVGLAPLAYPQLHLAALRGRPAEARALVRSFTAEATASGARQTITKADWATAVLSNGLAYYPAALAAAGAGTRSSPRSHCRNLSRPRVRCGEDDAAATALAELTERTESSDTPWALGVAAYARALVTGYEDDFRTAVGHLEASTFTPYHLLYGEWLRHQGRRRDASRELCTAHERLSDIGMTVFAARAAAELRASGCIDDLTTREAYIARLVAGAATSKRRVACSSARAPSPTAQHLSQGRHHLVPAAQGPVGATRLSHRARAVGRSRDRARLGDADPMSVRVAGPSPGRQGDRLALSRWRPWAQPPI